MSRKGYMILGIVLVVVGFTALFTNLFGTDNPGMGMVVFFATAFPGFICLIGSVSTTSSNLEK